MKDVYVAGKKKTKAEEKKSLENGKLRGEKTAGHLPLTRKPEEYSEVIRKGKADKSWLSAFMIQPKDMGFETQDPDEKVLLLLRRHVITNLRWLVTGVLLLLVPFVIEYVPGFGWLPMSYQVITVVVWYLMVLAYMFEKYLNWYFSVYIVTDERILDYDFHSLLYKRVSEAKLDKIEDVTYEMGGTLRSIFHFGTVYIQTAGESREFDFNDVPKPETVVKLLNELIMEEEREAIEGRVR